MDSEARGPDSDTDWQAIDIFVFCNGQQYSPPRKYHLQAEDINLWKSTLSFLAKTQYGPFQSTIDLYTIEGRRIGDPLQLSNGGTYVAVQPTDSFIEAGYEKYLLKASRSWEKRRAKRNEGFVDSNDPKNRPDMEDCDETAEFQNIKPMEGNLILKSRLSSIANYDASTIIKPQLLSAPQRRSTSPFAAKQTEKKKTSIQSPLVVRKITPNLLPTSNLKNPLSKKKDNLKSTVKITKPDERRNSSGNSGKSGCLRDNTGNTTLARISKPTRPLSKSRDSPMRSEAILPKIQETGNEVKTSSPFQVISTKNNEKLSTNSADLKNVFENNELLMVSNLFQNAHKDIPSISVNAFPIQSVSYEPERQTATTIIENTHQKPEEAIPRTIGDIKVNIVENDKSTNSEVIESINIKHDTIKNKARESVSIEKFQIEQHPNRTAENEEENNKVLKTDVIINTPKVDDNIITEDSPPRRRSIRVELPDVQNRTNNVANKFEEKLNNENTVSSSKSIETIKVNSSSPRSSVITNRVLESQYIANKTEETRVLSPTIEKTLNDQYKATLKTGDVVNLKLNIEIGNCDGNATRPNDNLNSRSVTIMQTDKGSQSNIDDQIIAQNKSLLSLIAKEIKNQHVGDYHRVIIIHYNTCKYCNDNVVHLNPDSEANKNYMILLPIEQLEEMKYRCHCNETQPEIQISSVINPVKPTYSCTSLQRLTKPTTSRSELPVDIATQNIYSSDTKSIENVVTVSSKKSVAINEESASNTRVPSKIIQEIHVKTQLLSVSVESIVQNIATDDKYTQTEWCDVLLEARLLSDGHYAFRLPPLELLKYYKLT